MVLIIFQLSHINGEKTALRNGSNTRSFRGFIWICKMKNLMASIALFFYRMWYRNTTYELMTTLAKIKWMNGSTSFEIENLFSFLDIMEPSMVMWPQIASFNSVVTSLMELKHTLYRFQEIHDHRYTCCVSSSFDCELLCHHLDCNPYPVYKGNFDYPFNLETSFREHHEHPVYTTIYPIIPTPLYPE